MPKYKEIKIDVGIQQEAILGEVLKAAIDAKKAEQTKDTDKEGDVNG